MHVFFFHLAYIGGRLENEGGVFFRNGGLGEQCDRVVLLLKGYLRL